MMLIVWYGLLFFALLVLGVSYEGRRPRNAGLLAPVLTASFSWLVHRDTSVPAPWVLSVVVWLIMSGVQMGSSVHYKHATKSGERDRRYKNNPSRVVEGDKEALRWGLAGLGGTVAGGSLLAARTWVCTERFGLTCTELLARDGLWWKATLGVGGLLLGLRLLTAVFGKTEAKEPLPPETYESLAAMLKYIAKVVWDKAIIKQSRLVLHQIAANAANFGIRGDLPYFYYLLFERSRDWPPMSPDDREAIMFAEMIITEAAVIPNYYNGFSVVSESKEGAMDEALKEFAVWARTGLRDAMLKDYLPIIQKYAPSASINLYLMKTDPERVRKAFETMVLGDPGSMGIHGYDLWTAVKIMQSR